jgi:hypothetical protein
MANKKMLKLFFKNIIFFYADKNIYQNTGFTALCSQPLFLKILEAVFQKWTFLKMSKIEKSR